MSKEVGRNDPCPCGSGKKYKKCCLSRDSKQANEQLNDKFQFKPGSYGDVGNFMPSIACMKKTKESEWIYHFVLVRPETILEDEDVAVEIAEKDLNDAFAIKKTGGTDEGLAMELKKRGYLNVESYNIVSNYKMQA